MKYNHKQSQINSKRNFELIHIYENVVFSYDLISPNLKNHINKHYKSNPPFGTVSIYENKNTKAVKLIANLLYFPKILFLYFSDRSMTHLHRCNAPAWIDYNPTTQIAVNIKFFENNIAHNTNGPQEIFFYNSGKPRLEIYRINNLIHREHDKPASICYWPNSKYKSSECYYINGSMSRKSDKPSSIIYDYNGNIREEYWYKENCLHRITGPAIIQYLKNNIKKTWIVNDKKIDRRIYPIFENNKPANKVKLTKASIFQTMLFDREYGTFLQTLVPSI
jgi:hypothetical protein